MSESGCHCLIDFLLVADRRIVGDRLEGLSVVIPAQTSRCRAFDPRESFGILVPRSTCHSPNSRLALARIARKHRDRLFIVQACEEFGPAENPGAVNFDMAQSRAVVETTSNIRTVEGTAFAAVVTTVIFVDSQSGRCAINRPPGVQDLPGLHVWLAIELGADRSSRHHQVCDRTTAAGPL